jgi:hypothetical protein
VLKIRQFDIFDDEWAPLAVSDGGYALHGLLLNSHSELSIQSMPRSIACRMAATDSRSSCGPQPNAQPPPPAAQDPNPTLAI